VDCNHGHDVTGAHNEEADVTMDCNDPGDGISTMSAVGTHNGEAVRVDDNAEASGSANAEASGSPNAEASGSPNAEASGSPNAEASGSANADASGSANAEASGSANDNASVEHRDPWLAFSHSMPPPSNENAVNREEYDAMDVGDAFFSPEFDDSSDDDGDEFKTPAIIYNDKLTNYQKATEDSLLNLVKVNLQSLAPQSSHCQLIIRSLRQRSVSGMRTHLLLLSSRLAKENAEVSEFKNAVAVALNERRKIWKYSRDNSKRAKILHRRLKDERKKSNFLLRTLRTYVNFDDDGKLLNLGCDREKAHLHAVKTDFKRKFPLSNEELNECNGDTDDTE
jgi:hypothetical protein